MLVTEARDLFEGGPDPDWRRYWTAQPLPYRIQPWSPGMAEANFLARFHMLNDAVRRGQ